jgi:hypothetical protein
LEHVLPQSARFLEEPQFMLCTGRVKAGVPLPGRPQASIAARGRQRTPSAEASLLLLGGLGLFVSPPNITSVSARQDQSCDGSYAAGLVPFFQPRSSPMARPKDLGLEHTYLGTRNEAAAHC